MLTAQTDKFIFLMLILLSLLFCKKAMVTLEEGVWAENVLPLNELQHFPTEQSEIFIEVGFQP